jgi:alkylation response protein AidB-like acyl-CoA dehydrogenase
VEDEKTLLCATVARFARHELGPLADTMERDPLSPLPAGVLEAAGAIGLLEIDAASPLLAAVLEVLSETSPAIATVVLSNALGRAHGGDGLCAFPCYGELFPPDPGVIASAEGAGFLLRGEARLVVNAAAATVVVVPIEVGGRARFAAVPLKSRGVSVGAAVRTLGMRGAPTADVRFDDVHVPGHVVGASTPGPGDFLAPAIAILSGILRASMATAEDYARERRQGGKRIGELAAIRELLSSLRAVATEARHAIAVLPSIDLRSAATWFVAIRRRAERAASAGVQVLGGIGYMEDFPQARRLRDARQALCLLGRNDVIEQSAWNPQSAHP